MQIPKVFHQHEKAEKRTKDFMKIMKILRSLYLFQRKGSARKKTWKEIGEIA